jgi:hypothetical protein
MHDVAGEVIDVPLRGLLAGFIQEGHDQGRGKVSISRLLRVSRLTVSVMF